MILTYDPSTVLIIIGTIPVLDWVSCRAVVPDKRDFMTGKDNEISRVNYKNSKIGTFELTIPQSSHYNIGLSAMEVLDLPIPIHVYEYNQILNRGTANDLGQFIQDVSSNTVTPFGSQLFLYPATFIRTPDIGYERTADNVSWLFKGYIRANIKSGFFTDI